MENLIKVTVDKRTELMGVLLLNSEYITKHADLVAECNNKEYRDKIIEHFSKFKDEKIFKLLNEIFEKYYFNYDAPIYLILQLNEDFTYNKLPNYPFKERLGEDKLILDFLNEIPKFVEKTNFIEFFNSNKDFYKKGINQIENLIKDYKIIDFLTDFYKLDLSHIKFVINLMHFATGSNYGTQNKNEFVCNCCLRKSEDGSINFIDTIDSTLTLYVHEFSHSIINPLIEKYNNIKLDFFNNIKEKMQNMYYWNVETIINEHIIRALEVIYLKKERKIPNHFFCAENYRKHCFNIGFIYIDMCISSLENYIFNKEKYKNFEEYFKKHKAGFNIK